MDHLTLRFEMDDGTVVDERIDLDFGTLTVPEFVAAVEVAGAEAMFTDKVLAQDPEGIELNVDAVAAVLYVKLRTRHPEFDESVYHQLRDLVVGLPEGRGVVVDA